MFRLALAQINPTVGDLAGNAVTAPDLQRGQRVGNAVAGALNVGKTQNRVAGPVGHSAGLPCAWRYSASSKV